MFLFPRAVFALWEKAIRLPPPPPEKKCMVRIPPRSTQQADRITCFSARQRAGFFFFGRRWCVAVLSRDHARKRTRRVHQGFAGFTGAIHRHHLRLHLYVQHSHTTDPLATRKSCKRLAPHIICTENRWVVDTRFIPLSIPVFMFLLDRRGSCFNMAITSKDTPNTTSRPTRFNKSKAAWRQMDVTDDGIVVVESARKKGGGGGALVEGSVFETGGYTVQLYNQPHTIFEIIYDYATCSMRVYAYTFSSNHERRSPNVQVTSERIDNGLHSLTSRLLFVRQEDDEGRQKKQKRRRRRQRR